MAMYLSEELKSSIIRGINSKGKDLSGLFDQENLEVAVTYPGRDHFLIRCHHNQGEFAYLKCNFPGDNKLAAFPNPFSSSICIKSILWLFDVEVVTFVALHSYDTRYYQDSSDAKFLENVVSIEPAIITSYGLPVRKGRIIVKTAS